MKKLLFLLPVALLLSACSLLPQGTTSESTSQASSSENTITAQGFAYSSPSVTVKAGATVTFTNKDIAGHSVTADDKSFDTGVIPQNESATFTAPTTPGTYKFHCTAHPNMTGTLVVE